jgi:hypothetical protein
MTTDQTPQQRWIVTVDPQENPETVAERLRAQGFEVEQILAEVGSITGFVPKHKVPELRPVPGVVAIEPDVEIQLPPPDSSPTW